jgi:diguanylate cyclase (GGDEF)-like protein
MARTFRTVRAVGERSASASIRVAMRAAVSVVGHSTRRRAANAVARVAIRLFDAPRAAVLLDPEAIRALDVIPPPPVRLPEMLTVVASVGRPTLHIDDTVALSGSLAGDAIRRRRLVSSSGRRGRAVVDRRAAETLWPDLPNGVAVPLVFGRRIVGVLAIGYDAPRGNRASDRQTLSGYASVAAVGLIAAIRHEAAVRQAIADPLTGLLNRAGFDRRLREELDRDHRATTVTGALVMMDLDHFKHVNDTWGHLVGDAVVEIVARHAIRTQIRSYDVPCRIGGDEFAVILPHTSLDNAAAVAERIRQAVLDAPTDTVGVPRGTIGASLGVVSFVAGGIGPDEIIARADRILYGAKSRGRNRVLTDGAM